MNCVYFREGLTVTRPCKVTAIAEFRRFADVTEARERLGLRERPYLVASVFPGKIACPDRLKSGLASLGAVEGDREAPVSVSTHSCFPDRNEQGGVDATRRRHRGLAVGGLR